VEPQSPKTCLNPHCGKEFVPGHYGQRQLVCREGTAIVSCPKCGGTGLLKGQECYRCRGKKKINQTCKEWYKLYWAQTRKPPRSVPEGDFEKIIGKLGEDLDQLSFYMVARDSGLRKGELLGLTWGDILHGESIRTSVNIRGQWDDRVGFKITKTGEAKLGYLLEDSRAVLMRLYKERRPRDRSVRIWEVSEATTWERWVHLQKDLGIANPDTGEPYRVHDLRHTAAHSAYKATGDLTKAQKLLGHKSLATTGIYSQERPEEFVAGLDKARRKDRE